jgi:hypothetical protein
VVGLVSVLAANTSCILVSSLQGGGIVGFRGVVRGFSGFGNATWIAVTRGYGVHNRSPKVVRIHFCSIGCWLGGAGAVLVPEYQVAE